MHPSSSYRTTDPTKWSSSSTRRAIPNRSPPVARSHPGAGEGLPHSSSPPRGCGSEGYSHRLRHRRAACSIRTPPCGVRQPAPEAPPPPSTADPAPGPTSFYPVCPAFLPAIDFTIEVAFTCEAAASAGQFGPTTTTPSPASSPFPRLPLDERRRRAEQTLTAVTIPRFR